MNRTTALSLMLLPVVIGALSQQTLTSGSQSQDEQDIWALEKAYFAHLADREFETLEKFWHPDFIGWPSHSAGPVGRGDSQASLEELTASLQKMSVELRPMAITHLGDVAVVHYFIDVAQEDLDGVSSEYTLRITHTWVNADGQWRILGGMSAQ